MDGGNSGRLPFFFLIASMIDGFTLNQGQVQTMSPANRQMTISRIQPYVACFAV